MVGDREKCIQAQMDVGYCSIPLIWLDLTSLQEYLSKPLKQNQLIQTILKCATLGGALLEQNQMMGSDGMNEHTRSAPPASSSSLSSATGGTARRPAMELRANTEVGAHSPSLLTADQTDPISVC
jgi:osomolarity two-component system sensor histidine kinase NIK1